MVILKSFVRYWIHTDHYSDTFITSFLKTACRHTKLYASLIHCTKSAFWALACSLSGHLVQTSPACVNNCYSGFLIFTDWGLGACGAYQSQPHCDYFISLPIGQRGWGKNEKKKKKTKSRLNKRRQLASEDARDSFGHFLRFGRANWITCTLEQHQATVHKSLKSTFHVNFNISPSGNSIFFLK